MEEKIQSDPLPHQAIWSNESDTKGSPYRTPIGLAFSGGGIRSASVSSGVLRRLIELMGDPAIEAPEADYISCVSGGGYLGSSFATWRYHLAQHKLKVSDWGLSFLKEFQRNVGYLVNFNKHNSAFYNFCQGIFDIILFILMLVILIVAFLFVVVPLAWPIALVLDVTFGYELRELCADAGGSLTFVVEYGVWFLGIFLLGKIVSIFDKMQRLDYMFSALITLFGALYGVLVFTVLNVELESFADHPLDTPESTGPFNFHLIDIFQYGIFPIATFLAVMFGRFSKIFIWLQILWIYSRVAHWRIFGSANYWWYCEHITHDLEYFSLGETPPPHSFVCNPNLYGTFETLSDYTDYHPSGWSSTAIAETCERYKSDLVRNRLFGAVLGMNDVYTPEGWEFSFYLMMGFFFLYPWATWVKNLIMHSYYRWALQSSFYYKHSMDEQPAQEIHSGSGSRVLSDADAHVDILPEKKQGAHPNMDHVDVVKLAREQHEKYSDHLSDKVGCLNTGGLFEHIGGSAGVNFQTLSRKSVYTEKNDPNYSGNPDWIWNKFEERYDLRADKFLYRPEDPVTYHQSRYVSCVTVNRWKANPNTNASPYEHMEISEEGMKRLDICRDGKGNISFDKEEPRLQVSLAMAVSAAALALGMGEFGSLTKDYKSMQSLMGFSLGRFVETRKRLSISAQFSRFLFTLISQGIIVVPMILAWAFLKKANGDRDFFPVETDWSSGPINYILISFIFIICIFIGFVPHWFHSQLTRDVERYESTKTGSYEGEKEESCAEVVINWLNGLKSSIIRFFMRSSLVIIFQEILGVIYISDDNPERHSEDGVGDSNPKNSMNDLELLMPNSDSVQIGINPILDRISEGTIIKFKDTIQTQGSQYWYRVQPAKGTPAIHLPPGIEPYYAGKLWTLYNEPFTLHSIHKIPQVLEIRKDPGFIWEFYANPETAIIQGQHRRTRTSIDILDVLTKKDLSDFWIEYPPKHQNRIEMAWRHLQSSKSKTSFVEISSSQNSQELSEMVFEGDLEGKSGLLSKLSCRVVFFTKDHSGRVHDRFRLKGDVDSSSEEKEAKDEGMFYGYHQLQYNGILLPIRRRTYLDPQPDQNHNPRNKSILKIKASSCISSRTFEVRRRDTPQILALSDGGHTENLAILPLLARYCKTIIAVDGGADPDGECLELYHMIKVAREKLQCKFLPISDSRGDIETAIYLGMVVDKKNLSFSFRVVYDKLDSHGNPLTGIIIYLKPRRGVTKNWLSRFEDQSFAEFKIAKTLWQKQYKRYRNLMNSNEMDFQLDEARDQGNWIEEADLIDNYEAHLAGCCCECCHDLFRTDCCSNDPETCVPELFGEFPNHFTGNQFFSQRQFSAYHRVGYLALCEAIAKRLICFKKADINVEAKVEIPNSEVLIDGPPKPMGMIELTQRGQSVRY